MSLDFREISFQNTRFDVDCGVTVERFVQRNQGSPEQSVPVAAPVSVDITAGGKPVAIWQAYDGRDSGVSGQMRAPADRKVDGDAGHPPNSPPTGSVTINGLARQGQTLTADAGALADADGLGVFAYQWLRDGHLITDAYSSDYDLRVVDVGHQISVRVIYADAGGRLEIVASDMTQEITTAHGFSPLGREFQVDSFAGGGPGQGQRQASVAGLSDGGYVITWQSDGQDGDSLGIYGQRYDANGGSLGPEFLINTNTTGSQAQPSTAGLAAGGFVVTWSSNGQNVSSDGVYGQRYDASGARLGAEFRIDTGTEADQSGQTFAALSDGGFVVTWGGGEIYGQRYDSNGASLGSAFHVNTSMAGSQSNSAIAALSGGGFVVTWESTDGDALGIFGQRYDADASRLGVEFQINTYTAAYQWTPSITGLANGGFVVTWKSDGQDGSKGGIYGQRYDADATRLGAEFLINSHTAEQQYTPSVTALSNGGFIVAWTSDGHNGAGRDVYAQHYGADGTTVGAEFRVNSHTSGNQWIPSIAGLSGDGFVVAWQSLQQGGIYAQQFSLGDNTAPTGRVAIYGTATEGETLTAEAGALADQDGLGMFGYQWLRDGVEITGAVGARYELGQADVGAQISLRVGYSDGLGAEEAVTSALTIVVGASALDLVGTNGADRLVGGEGGDTLNGGNGHDTLIGGGGNDRLIGGNSADDLRDVIYGGEGDDVIDGGFGNDELRGDAGDDNIAGGAGADRVIGGTGNDTLSGGGLGDELFGGDGFDFINGGFGYDRVNGGAGGDKFYHLGIADHGSDWVQDYLAADGDVLLWGGGAATAADFLIQRAETANAGVAGVAEIFVTHIPSGNLLWALVDGDAQTQINIQIAGQVYDLLG